MATQEALDQAQQLYVAYYGRPADQAGLQFWASKIDEEGLDAVMNDFGTSAEFEARFGDLSNEELVENLYQQMFGRAADAEGLAFYTERLNDGRLTLPEIAATIAGGAQNDDATILGNKVAAANLYTEAAGDAHSGSEADDYAANWLASIDADTDVEELDIAAVVAGIPEPTEPEEPGVPGQEYLLTPNADRIEGTADNDEFIAPMGTLNFVNGNTLNTGDVLDGNGGTNTLKADLINDSFSQSGLGAVRPTTENIQNVEITAIDTDGTNGTNGNTVTLNASRMVDVEHMGSYNSDAHLTIADITTKTSDGGPRNTEELTFRMDHTSNANSSGQASNLTVYFDENYLLAGEVPDANIIQYEVMNQDAWDLINVEGRDDVELLDAVTFREFKFTLNGDEYDLVELGYFDAEQGDVTGTAIRTHDQLRDLVEEALIDLGLNDQITVSMSTFDERDGLGNPTGDRNDVPAVVLTGAPGVNLTANENFVDLARATENEIPNSNRYDRANDQIDPGRDEDVTTNLELHKVGRGSEGGDALIGGKSQSDSSQGIPVFNIDVLGGDDKPSNLGWIGTTNDALRDVNIASNDSEHRDGDDTWASLTVRNGFGTNATGVNGGGNFRHTGIETIDADAFLGDLTLGGAAITEFTQNARILNVNEFTATGGGDVEYWGEVTTSGEYSYTTGSGDDTIDMALDNSSLNTIGDELSISTGSGDDVVNLSGTPASQQTMAELDNIHVDTGSGDDEVFITGGVRANVDAGSGNDFVVINGNDGNGGTWTFGDASGPQTFQARVLYQAEMTVTFAGFESTVSIPTDANGNYVATQLEINEAIRDAVESHPDLARLLTVSEGSGTQQVEVTANHGGENALTIEINQPNVVDTQANAGAGDVVAPNQAGNLSALIQGLIDTNPNWDSSDFEDGAEDVATALSGSNVGNVGQAGGYTNGDYQVTDLGGSSNSATSFNVSVVNMGPGAEDLVVFDSNVNSANVLEIDGQFDHVSVVNFFDTAPQTVDDVAQVGNHALDFTAFLDNQNTASGSTGSATDINITLNAPHSPLNGTNANSQNNQAIANSVNMLGFDELVGPDSLAFADLTASNLVAQLNQGNTAANEFGGLEASSLNAADYTGDELIGSTQKHIVMVENVQNPGEYKVFYLTSTVDENGNVEDNHFDTGAELLGTLDFGQSINFGLVGNEDWEANVADLIAQADGRAPRDEVFTAAEDIVVDVDDAATTRELSIDLGTEGFEAATSEEYTLTIELVTEEGQHDEIVVTYKEAGDTAPETDAGAELSSTTDFSTEVNGTVVEAGADATFAQQQSATFDLAAILDGADVSELAADGYTFELSIGGEELASATLTGTETTVGEIAAAFGSGGETIDGVEFSFISSGAEITVNANSGLESADDITVDLVGYSAADSAFFA